MICNTLFYIGSYLLRDKKTKAELATPYPLFPVLEIKLNLSLLKYCKLANTTTVLQEIIEINLRCKKLGFPYFQAKYVLLNNPYVKAFLLKSSKYRLAAFHLYALILRFL